ncbi:MAG: hypothetical protein QM488_16250 [Rhizobiaceae bacterium]
MVYSTELVIVVTTVLALGVAGFIVRRMIQHVDKRIHLMLRASYHNSRDIKENLETVDVVRSETRKAFEHQRVLLNSLNQQIKNLESVIAGENFGERPEFVAEPNPVKRRAMPKRMMRKAKPERAVRKKVETENIRKSRKRGLLGNLDDFLERGIEQIVANDVRPEKAERYNEPERSEVSERYIEPELEFDDEIQTPVHEPVSVVEAEMAVSAEEDVINFVEPDVMDEVAEVQKEVKRSVQNARRGGVISMDKLLKQQKQQRLAQGEKTEKIVKLSSIFSNRGRVAHATDDVGRKKHISVG